MALLARAKGGWQAGLPVETKNLQFHVPTSVGKWVIIACRRRVMVITGFNPVFALFFLGLFVNLLHI